MPQDVPGALIEMLLQIVIPWDGMTDMVVCGIFLHYYSPYYVTDMVAADVMRNILSPRLQYHSAPSSQIYNLCHSHCRNANTETHITQIYKHNRYR